MGPDDREALIDVVDRWIRAKVRGEALPAAPSDGAFDDAMGVFVTIRVAGELRGCIGTLERTTPLGATALRMAGSALQDPRFSERRVSAEELGDLSVEVMLLGPIEPVAGAGDIEIGRHGIVVELGGRSGVFLPQVAVEYGWDAVTAIEQICKNKLRMPADSWRLPEAKLSVFVGERVSRPEEGA